MSVRVRVAVALIVAAVVPLIGVFVIGGVLLPSTVASQDRARLGEAATSAASLLAQDCVAVGDRAALLVSRLQVAVSVADPALAPEQVVAEVAPAVLARSGEPLWTLGVLAPDGDVLAASGAEADEVAADPERYAALDCGSGDLGAPAALGVTAPLQLQGETVGSVLVVSALDAEALGRLEQRIGTGAVSLALLEGEDVVAASPGLRQPADGDEQDVLDRLGEELADPAAAGDEPQGLRRTRVQDRLAVAVGPVLQDLDVVAVGPARPTLSRELALAFVVTALGAAALVWLLSATLTRPLAELGELARRIAAGGDGGTGTMDDAETDTDVQGVSAVLGSLARDLRASEVDAQRRREAFLDAFSRFGDALQQTHDRDGLLQTVLQAALLGAEAPMGLALHHDRSSRTGRREVSLRARPHDGRDGRDGHDGPGGPDPLDEGTRQRLSSLAERALVERQVVELPGSDVLGPVLAVPLGGASRPLGAVVVAREVGAPGFDPVAFDAIGALATNAGTALGNIKQHQEVERLSVTDPLTGVNNFRHLSTMLARELERAARFGHPLGVLMLDIDRFKPVNDTYGHAAGDAVLRELARRVKECVREVDTVARYGGEEFALLLPETDLDGSAALAGRVLAAIRSEVFRLPDGPDLLITASIGVAGYPGSGATATDVMRAADEALYRAKSSGRDRVEVAGGALAGADGALGAPDGDVSP